ncbi:MAG TPA: lysylphosphatidylglycerol synthase transmembrane domain-containing protein [Chloroflexota bacterium]|nr:lysylphosphatidylglycerol synthase transmembrane domain-containing protein [Chloroflexota bacterium]
MRLLTRLLGLALTGVFLVLALSKVDLQAFAQELRTVDYRWLIPSALLTLLGYGVRTLRWQVILSGSAKAPFTTLFPILTKGFATNNLLPGRLGEFWRAYLFGRKQNVGKTFALASVFVERVFDGLTLILLLGVVSTAIQLPGWSRQIEALAGLIFVGASAGVVLILWRPNLVERIVQTISRPLPGNWARWSNERLLAFIDGLTPLRTKRVLLTAALFSLGVWLLEGGSYLLLSRGVNLGLPAFLLLPGLGLALVVINLGIMVPSGPGYVGTQEFFGASALGAVGANPQSALALVVVSHAVQYALITGLGLLFLAREQLLPRDLRPVLAKEAAG